MAKFGENLLIAMVDEGLVDVEVGQDGSVRLSPTLKAQRALDDEGEGGRLVPRIGGGDDDDDQDDEDDEDDDDLDDDEDLEEDEVEAEGELVEA